MHLRMPADFFHWLLENWASETPQELQRATLAGVPAIGTGGDDMEFVVDEPLCFDVWILDWRMEDGGLGIVD